ncbi:MAG: class D sortase [Streptococcaceae bacterium]|nr:class D sortase [Streptococcaceae bacterium]
MIGYGVIWALGRPVIIFASNVTRLLLLNDKPDFKDIGPNLYDSSKSKAKGQLKASQITYPKTGSQFGEVIAASVDVKMPLYYGDTDTILSLGAGMYPDSKYPGEMGTSIIGGHNRPTFGQVSYLKVGDRFEIKTSYADYTYEVTDARIIDANDPWVGKMLGQKDESLAFLYTCYPLDAIGWAKDRAVVIGKVVDGPIIDEHA